MSRPKTSGLTPREAEVAGLLVFGLMCRGIAQTLYLEPGTVRLHLTHIRRKLVVHTAAEIIQKVEAL